MNVDREDETRNETRNETPNETRNETPNETREEKRTRSGRLRSAAERWVRVDAGGDDALARCEAVLCIGKALAADPDLRWAYDEAARIAAGPPRRPRAARMRTALASPALAWSAAAVSSIVAIVALGIANSAGPGPAAPETTADSSTQQASAPFPAAATDSAPTIDARSDTRFASPVVVLPGRVFVDAGSVAVLPFGVEVSASSQQPSPRAQAVASDLYADLVRRLESIPGIYVAQPVSVLPYADADLGAEQIASQLGVRGIIEGRVAAVADRMRITLSLTDAATDDVVWRGTIERRADEVANVGADMAADAAAALGNAPPPPFDAANY
jgi:TolB-like protein